VSRTDTARACPLLHGDVKFGSRNNFGAHQGPFAQTQRTITTQTTLDRRRNKLKPDRPTMTGTLVLHLDLHPTSEKQALDY
jgi:hypothetical protein